MPTDEPERPVDPDPAEPGRGGSPEPGRGGSPDETVGLDDEVVVPRPIEATPATAPRGPVALAGTYVVGLAMGTADLVPGFSGGTVALLAGIYERLIANVRQGAHVLSLLVRGRAQDAWRAFVAIEWPFVGVLLAGIATAAVVLATTLDVLLEERPMVMAAVFLGLVLGATAVAQRELREPAWWQAIIMLGVAALTFVGLGYGAGTIEDPALYLFLAGGALGVCALILPGVSGAFILVLLGLYEPVLTALGERDVLVVLVFLIGAVAGLAAFSTALNYLLRRWHDLILAALLGLMLGSSRVLWPWPDGIDSPDLAAPPGNEWLLALSVGMAAFAVIWLLALVVPGSKERDEQRRIRTGRTRA